MATYTLRTKDLKQIKRCLELSLGEINYINKNYDVNEIEKIRSNLVEINRVLSKIKKLKDNDDYKKIKDKD